VGTDADVMAGGAPPRPATFFGEPVALLALVSRRAPAQAGGAMLGVIFLGLFVAKTTMGWIGSLYETMTPTVFWSLDAAIAAAGAAIIFALSGVLAPRC